MNTKCTGKDFFRFPFPLWNFLILPFEVAFLVDKTNDMALEGLSKRNRFDAESAQGDAEAPLQDFPFHCFGCFIHHQRWGVTFSVITGLVEFVFEGTDQEQVQIVVSSRPFHVTTKIS